MESSTATLAPFPDTLTPKGSSLEDKSSELRTLLLWELVETARVFPTGIPLKDSPLIYYPFESGLQGMSHSRPVKIQVSTDDLTVADSSISLETGESTMSEEGAAGSGQSTPVSISTKKSTPSKNDEVIFDCQDKLLDYWIFQRCRPDWRERLELFGYQDAFDV